MKKVIILLITAIIPMVPAFAKQDKTPDNFADLGRYIETFETNEPDINTAEAEEEFEEQAIDDVSRRYEDNIIELKLDEINDNAIKSVNKERVFRIRINEDKYNIENMIKNENMIWDSSKTFSQAFFTNSRHLAPIPSVINSSKISTIINPSLSASLGQAYLYDANGPSALFIRANESTYNTGAVISYRGNGLKLSTGAFSSSYNHASSGGAVLTTESIKLPFNTGSFLLGGGIFSKEEQEYDTTTGGGFIEYSFKRLKLNAQVGQSRYSNTSHYDTSLYLTPEVKLSDSLYLKTRFIKNITQDTVQNEVALTYKPVKNNNNLEFEINTTNRYNQNENAGRRIKLSTSFKI